MRRRRRRGGLFRNSLRHVVRRAFRAARGARGVRGDTAPDANVVAVSDLHLGHDLKRDGPPLHLRPTPFIDLQLGSLVEHLTQSPDRLPWRLVIAGDMVDFVAITRTPGDDEEVDFEVSDQERRFGLLAEPVKAAWKLRQVMRRHEYLVARLADFVAQGNDLVIIRGNHDAEWYWPEVRDVFRDALARHVADRVTRADGTPDDEPGGWRLTRARRLVEARTRFCDWFYLEPGRLYVEHGHVHDEYSTWDDVLAPEMPGARLMREPLSSLAMRYFANDHASLDLSEAERWTAIDYLRWGLSGGNVGAVTADYLRLCGRLLAFSARMSFDTLRRSARALVRAGAELTNEERARRDRIRAALAVFRRDQDEIASELLALIRVPAERNVIATAQLLYIDRLVLGGLLLGTTVYCALKKGPVATRAALLLGAVAGGLAGNAALSLMRRVDSHPKLLAAAHRVAVLFGVRYVVMGHSHHPVSREVGHGARYFNLGTWIGATAPEDGGEPLHYMLLTEAGAGLRRWRAPVRTKGRESTRQAV